MNCITCTTIVLLAVCSETAVSRSPLFHQKDPNTFFPELFANLPAQIPIGYPKTFVPAADPWEYTTQPGDQTYSINGSDVVINLDGVRFLNGSSNFNVTADQVVVKTIIENKTYDVDVQINTISPVYSSSNWVLSGSIGNVNIDITTGSNFLLTADVIQRRMTYRFRVQEHGEYQCVAFKDHTSSLTVVNGVVSLPGQDQDVVDQLNTNNLAQMMFYDQAQYQYDEAEYRVVAMLTFTSQREIP
jgi:hypothetical protein